MVKAAVSVLLLLSLGLPSAVLWNAFRRSGGHVPAASATGTALLALAALVAAMANVQAAAAPVASLLPMLTRGSPRGELAAALTQAEQRLHDDPGERTAVRRRPWTPGSPGSPSTAPSWPLSPRPSRSRPRRERARVARPPAVRPGRSARAARGGVARRLQRRAGVGVRRPRPLADAKNALAPAEALAAFFDGSW
ncbi:hypothetical protein [Streptomyces sp. NPDC004042]|uniref:hypothetical protein n=1 Tax=Streptomyces sp. NPDC004042 TaxID=3154451 RepID=UPI0033A902AC